MRLTDEPAGYALQDSGHTVSEIGSSGSRARTEGALAPNGRRLRTSCFGDRARLEMSGTSFEGSGRGARIVRRATWTRSAIEVHRFRDGSDQVEFWAHASLGAGNLSLEMRSGARMGPASEGQSAEAQCQQWVESGHFGCKRIVYPVSPIGSAWLTLSPAAGRRPTRVNQASSSEHPSGIGWPMPRSASMYV